MNNDAQLGNYDLPEGEFECYSGQEINVNAHFGQVVVFGNLELAKAIAEFINTLPFEIGSIMGDEYENETEG